MKYMPGLDIKFLILKINYFYISNIIQILIMSVH
jgi:hypothetical protein